MSIALVIALLVAATAGYVLTRPKPTLTLSSGVIRAGGTLVVNASNVPANQQGEVQLLSVLHTVPFQADANGNATVYLTVPLDTQPGDHTVRICWSGTCHVSQTVLVLAPVSEASPSPTAGGPPPSPGASPSAAPGPSPTPHATPATTPPSTAYIVVFPSNPLPGTSVTVTGFHFSAFRGVSILLFDPPSSKTQSATASATTGPQGSFSQKMVIPLLTVNSYARIEACDTRAVCAYTIIKIT